MNLRTVVLCGIAVIVTFGCTSNSDENKSVSQVDDPGGVAITDQTDGTPLNDVVDEQSVGGNDDGGSLGDDDNAVDAGSTDGGETSEDNESSDEGESADNGETTSDDGISDDGETTDDDGSAEGGDTETADASVINGDNYISLTRFAVQMNVIILAEGTFSPVLFLKRFPPTAADVDNDDGVDIDISGSCSGGGSYKKTGFAAGPDGNSQTAYDACAEGAEVLNGSIDYIYYSGGREYTNVYDLTLTANESADGAGTTVFKGDLGHSCDACVFRTFKVEDYSRNSSTNPFFVSGSGSYSALEGVEEHNSKTIIRLQNPVTPINLEVTIDSFKLLNDVPYKGTIVLSAQDDSKVEVTVPDQSGNLAITRTNKSGDAFSDTVSWNELYQP